jgi:MYXO-CTERM domain-containing protein
MRQTLSLLSVCAALLVSPVAFADLINPAEGTCQNATAGSACNSSTTSAGGTCIQGCCCKTTNGGGQPLNPPQCGPCLACSDTAGTDGAFKAGSCDGGATPPATIDAGPLATPDSGSTSSSAPAAAKSGCASAAAGATSSPSAWSVLVGAALFVALRRRRS